MALEDGIGTLKFPTVATDLPQSEKANSRVIPPRLGSSIATMGHGLSTRVQIDLTLVLGYKMSKVGRDGQR